MYKYGAQCGMCRWLGIFPNDEIASTMLRNHHEIAHKIFLQVEVVAEPVIPAEIIPEPKQLEVNNGN